jgi:hypothetical protein
LIYVKASCAILSWDACRSDLLGIGKIMRPPTGKSHGNYVEAHSSQDWFSIRIVKNFISLVGVLASVLSLQLGQSTPAKAQDLQDSPIDIAYVEPNNARFQPIYDELKRRQVLEELKMFLSPLRLPRKVLVKTAECGTDAVPYEPGKPIIVCYEYVAQIVKLAPALRTPNGVSRENTIIGAFVQFVLHEMSFAVFDLLEVPVWGREQDAADKLAAFIMLQFGKDLAVRTFTGALWFFEASNRTWTGSDFASETSTEAQRFYNYLCIAYGGDPNTFEDLVRDTLLKTRRAPRCAVEYRQLDYAFRQSILATLDPDRLRKVQSLQWAMPEN